MRAKRCLLSMKPSSIRGDQPKSLVMGLFNRTGRPSWIREEPNTLQERNGSCYLEGYTIRARWGRLTGYRRSFHQFRCIAPVHHPSSSPRPQEGVVPCSFPAIFLLLQTYRDVSGSDTLCRSTISGRHEESNRQAKKSHQREVL